MCISLMIGNVGHLFTFRDFQMSDCSSPACPPFSLCLTFSFSFKSPFSNYSQEIQHWVWKVLSFVFWIFFFFFFFFFFFVFLGLHLLHMEVPSWGSNQSCSFWPQPQPQHRQIQAASVTYTTAHGNTVSLTHWGTPGIEPTSSGIRVRFVIPEQQRDLLILIKSGRWSPGPITS